MRSIVLGALLLGFLGATGCATYGPTMEEPLRVATVADLAPSAVLRQGETRLEDAKAIFQSRGLTGVVADAHVVGSSGTFGVIGADYQRHLSLFQNDRFVGALALPTGGLPPYGLALRIAEEAGAPEILVLYRDPLDRDEEPPTLLLFKRTAEGFALEVRTPLDEVVHANGGMSSPMLLGDSISEGILLVARDRDGELWDTGYFLRRSGSTIHLEPQPLAEAMRCSCVRKYAAGIL